MPYERRHFVRVGFDAPCLLTTTQDAYSVTVQDLSLKGALLIVPPEAQLVSDQPCKITIPLAEAGVHITMFVTVAHIQGEFTGMQCRSIDLDSVTHLRRLIEYQLGDPALLERDLDQLSSPSL